MKRKVMKTTLVTALIVLLAIALVACQNTTAVSGTPSASTAATTAATSTASVSASASSLATGAGSKLIIGISFNSMDASNTQIKDALQQVFAAKDCELITTDAQSNVQKQMDDILTLIQRKCNVIMIKATDPNGVASGADACAEAGIPVVDMTGDLASDKVAHRNQLDQTPGGKILADYIREFLTEHPDVNLKVGYLWGMKQAPAVQQRYHGVFDNLKDLMDEGRITILDEQDAGFDTQKAMNDTENWLQKYKEMNCIITAGDNMAIGAVNVLKAANADFSKWYVIGFDCRELADPINQGTALADVYLNVPAVIQDLGDVAIKLAKGEKIDDSNQADYWKLVTKDTVKDIFGDQLSK